VTSPGAASGGVRVAACLASTLDGRLAHPRIPVLGSDGDRQRLETLRAQADVLLYGAGTARADSRRRIEFRYSEIGRPVLSRLGLPVPPMAVLCRDTTFDFTSPFWSTPTRKLLLHARPEPTAAAASARPAGLPRNVDYLAVASSPKRTGMSVALRGLAGWLTGVREPAPLPGGSGSGQEPVRVLCEGGGALVAGLLGADLLDELFLTLTGWIAGDDDGAPLSVGGTIGGTTGARHLTLQSAEVASSTSEVFLRYRREGRPAWPITEHR
jgi:5-amino-6-(5-phosphoribosylamino)uracil reductase